MTHPDFPGWFSEADGTITTRNPKCSRAKDSINTTVLFDALLKHESIGGRHFKEQRITTSRVGALGFGQIMPFNVQRYNDSNDSAAQESKNDNLYDPRVNLRWSARILNESLDHFAEDKDQLEKALAAYNGGHYPRFMKGKNWQHHVEYRVLARESTRYAIMIKRHYLLLEPTEWEQDYLDGNVRVEVVVLDEDKCPIEGAEVAFTREKAKKVGITGVDGRIIIKVPENTHDVTVTRKGYERKSEQGVECRQKLEREYVLKGSRGEIA